MSKNMTGETSLVPGLVDLFGELADEETRGCIEMDLAEVPAEELAKQFRDACGVLEGLLTAAEAANMPTYTVLADACRRAHEARRRAEAAAGLPVSRW